MDAVILFSHGSLLCGAGGALEAHAARLRTQDIAPLVAAGYLNYSAPSFAETAAQCVSAGTSRIIVVPYFLVPGYFVKVDLPKAVAAAKVSHPDVAFVVAEALGYDERLAEALIESARQAAPPSAWRDDLCEAAAHCRANPECPLYGTPDCLQRPSSAPYATSRRAYSEREQAAPSERAALLVLVHGSPNPAANSEMFQVVERIRTRSIFPIVEAGFLECNAPSIPEAIDACVAQGAERILAVPYFLHTGKHVADDLPTLLEQGSARHPGVEFRLGRYLGCSERITEILSDRIHAVQ